MIDGLDNELKGLNDHHLAIYTKMLEVVNQYAAEYEKKNQKTATAETLASILPPGLGCLYFTIRAASLVQREAAKNRHIKEIQKADEKITEALFWLIESELGSYR